MYLDYVFEISNYPIQRKKRIAIEEIKKIMPKYPWWEYKKAVLYELEDLDDARKEVFKELKKDLPSGCTIDVESGILKCPKDRKYLKDTISRLQKLLSDPESIMACDRPVEWWRLAVDQFGRYLFFSNPYCNEFFTLHELMLLSMGDYYKEDNSNDVVFYIGGIFYYFEP